MAVPVRALPIAAGYVLAGMITYLIVACRWQPNVMRRLCD